MRCEMHGPKAMYISFGGDGRKRKVGQGILRDKLQPAQNLGLKNFPFKFCVFYVAVESIVYKSICHLFFQKFFR